LTLVTRFAKGVFLSRSALLQLADGGGDGIGIGIGESKRLSRRMFPSRDESGDGGEEQDPRRGEEEESGDETVGG
jgi:hypothetical protein